MHNNEHPLQSNTKGYGCKTHYNVSQDSDTIAHSGRKLYYLLFLAYYRAWKLLD